jgi:hypothetical protein
MLASSITWQTYAERAEGVEMDKLYEFLLELNFLESMGLLFLFLCVLGVVVGTVDEIKHRMSINAYYRDLYEKYPEKNPKNKDHPKRQPHKGAS